MRTPLPPRRLVGSVPCALLAVLLVLLRLLAPAAAMPQADPALAEFDRVARESICHASSGDAGGPAGEAPGDHVDCLQCPACHLVSAALPMPNGPAVPAPVAVAVPLAAAPPPATGPPGRVRGSAQPTGPPAVSA